MRAAAGRDVAGAACSVSFVSSEVPLWLALSLEKRELVFTRWSPWCSGHYYYTITFCSLLHHYPRASRQHTQVTLCPERGGGVLQTWLTFSLKRDPKYFLKHFQSHVFILSGLIVYSSDLNPFQSVRAGCFPVLNSFNTILPIAYLKRKLLWSPITPLVLCGSEVQEVIVFNSERCLKVTLTPEM